MTKTRLSVSLLGLAAVAALVWFAGPLIAVGGRVPLDSDVSRIACIAAIVLLWALVVVWRVMAGRQADRRLTDALAAAPAAPAPEAGSDDAMARAIEESDLLRERFREALAVLRQSRRRGRARLAELPWYVLIGPPGAGKTTALKNSGLQFPLADRFGADALRGVGGTRHCDWWFTDQAVLLDTAGRYTTQDSDEAVDGSAWAAFLALLKRHRRQRPINGIVVAISLADILSPDTAQREQQARAIRQRIAELHEAFGLRFPVYVMFTKSDCVAGFNEFFDDLERDARRQVWGMSFAADEGDALARFAPEFDALVARLNDRLLARLAGESDASRRAVLFGFPREVAMLKDDIARFLADVFGASRYDDTAWLRGVYLTSATQSGTPIDRALAAVTRSFGLGGIAPAASGAAAGAGRSYFLADLLQRVIFPEAELVGHDRRLERRRRWLHGLAYGAALCTVAAGAGWWAVASAQGQQSIARLGERVRAYVPVDAQALPAQPAWPELLARLDALRALPAGDGAASAPSRGLRQPRRLEQAAQRTYLREMNRLFAPRMAAALAQTLRDARRDTDPTYATLKGYLMLAQPEHRDPAYLKALLQLQWERELPRDPSGVARLGAHFDTLLAEGLAPITLDADLVRDARSVLNRVPLAELAYSRLKRDALAHDDRPFVPRDALGAAGAAAFERASGVPLSQPVPGLFTARGYAEVFVPQSQRLTQSLRSEIWVLGTERGELTAKEAIALGDDVLNLYVADYQRTWKDLLADLRIATPRSPAQGLDVLAGLSGRNSALRTLLLAVDTNTRLATGGPAAMLQGRLEGQAAAGAQQAKNELATLLKVNTLAPATGEKAPTAQLEAAFADLGALVHVDKDGRAPLDAVIERLAALYAELGAAPSNDGMIRADSPAARRLTEIALAQPQPVKDWLLQIGTASTQAADRQQQAALAKKRMDDAVALREKINTAWKSEVLPFCTAAVTRRYPIDRRSPNDATLKDFGRLFGPGGLIDAFVKDKLLAFIDTGSKPWRWRAADQLELNASADALRQIEIAAGVRDAFFRDGGALPAVEFALRPLPAEAGVQRVALTQGDQPLLDRATPPAFKTTRWPAGDGVAPLNLGIEDLNGKLETRSAEGPWALFRLLDQAALDRVSPDRVVATFRLPTHMAQLELRASSVVNPFQPNGLDQFQCPKAF